MQDALPDNFGSRKSSVYYRWSILGLFTLITRPTTLFSSDITMSTDGLKLIPRFAHNCQRSNSLKKYDSVSMSAGTAVCSITDEERFPCR